MKKTTGRAEVDECIQAEPVVAKKMLKEIRALVRKLAPQAEEKLAWGMPTFTLDGILLTYAAFSKHVSLFPGPDAIVAFEKELGKFTISKGTIQIPFEEKIPTALIGKLVRFCVKRNRAAAQAKAEKKKSKTKKTTKTQKKAKKK